MKEREQATDLPDHCQEIAPCEGNWSQLADDLFLWRDSCSVYLLRRGDRALVIDAGTGAWSMHLDELGVRHIDGVVLTHTDRDQCCAMYRDDVPTILSSTRLVVPSGDAPLLQPEHHAEFWRQYQLRGCPSHYAAPALPRTPDDTISGDSERLIGPTRLCAITTPGHTQGALSYIVEWHSQQLAFCGDAVTSDGTVVQPFQLEWDHWTPEGALAAWYGLERLASNRIDRLLPAHGEPISGGRAILRKAQRRLLNFVRAKTAVAPGARSRWADTEPLACGANRLSKHLYSVGGNGFVLAADNGAALVIDPTKGDMPALAALLDETGLVPDVATASHYHIDHTDALNHVQERWGARIWLHPRVAEPIADCSRLDVPWLPADAVEPDRLLPENGVFRWRNYRFDIRPFPGQTWWHCAFDTRIDGRHVLFSGDNFQPPTRWNGTGGFCAYNGSRFSGFASSAQIVLDMAPDLICNGHRCIYEYDPDQYQRILAWCTKAEDAVRALCPADSDWLADYDPRTCRWEPFVQTARAGDELSPAFIYTNHRSKSMKITIRPVPRADFQWSPAKRTLTIPAGATRRVSFRLQANAASGRHILAADIHEPSRVRAEAAVTLIDVS